MLVLKRKVDEEICSGDDIVIQVVGVQAGCVRLGVVAPKDMPVHRREVYERIKAEKLAETAE